MPHSPPSTVDMPVLQDRTASRMLFIACWIAYAASYVGRIGYYTALPAMIESRGFTKGEAGLIGTAFFLCYGLGQTLSGLLADRLPAHRMILSGLALSAAANLLMSTCGTHILLALVWGSNGFAQSMLWTPILHLFVHVLHPEHRQRACLYISASPAAGTIITYLFSFLLLRTGQWQWIFMLGSFVMVVAAAGFYMVFRRCKAVPPANGQDNAPIPHLSTETPQTHSTHAPHTAVSALAVYTLLFLTLAVLIHGMLKEGIAVWVPTMLTETYQVTSSFSVFLTTALAVAGLAGPYIIDRLHRKRLHGNEAASAALCFTLALPAIALLIRLTALPIAVGIILLALVTICMTAVNYVLVTLIPVRFAPYHRASTASGVLNSVTYLGSALASFVFGVLADRFGWSTIVLLWLLLAVAGIMLCLTALRGWRRFVSQKTPHADSQQTSSF